MFPGSATPRSPTNERATDPVVLISCYELGHEPLGVIVPAAVMSRRGIHPRVIDLAVERVDDDAIGRARIVGISAPMHTALRLGARVARHVRRINPDAHVVFYGLYAGLNAGHLCPELADSCLGAEFESALADFAERVLTERGLNARDLLPQSSPIESGVRLPGRSIDLSPGRDVIAHRDHYARLDMDRRRVEVGYVPASRGCKHLCTHCPLPVAYAGRFYAIPVERVMDDIASLVGRGAGHITFADPDFLNGPGHALRVARSLHGRFPGITFDFTAKIEHLKRHANVAAELRDLGAVFVVSAVESMNDEALHHLRKGHTRQDALDVIRSLRATGLPLRPSLVPFTPWETRPSLEELFDIVESEGLVRSIDPVQYSIRLLIPEGSLLLGDATVRARLGGFDRTIFGYAWTHPDPAMDALQGTISRLAEDAARDSTDTLDAFARIRACVQPGRTVPSPAVAGAPVPRLTEDWFC